MSKPIVSIIGRPNVGKSCLFNRILGRRAAVVDDESGVTRDRNYADGNWQDHTFTLVDTGGILPPSRDMMAEEIRAQVELAIRESAVIVFVVDTTTGPTDLDLFVARLLQRAEEGTVVVAANKAESPAAAYEIPEFLQLGLGDPWAVSALHGQGVGDLLDRVCEAIGTPRRAPEHDNADRPMRIAVLGRPNAGKSSLVNRLLGEKRMIVHDQPGTTRDAIDTLLRYHGKEILLVDTAGLRKKARVHERVEYYSNVRALGSLQRADICVLVVDAVKGVEEQDVRILRQINDAHKGAMLCLNKWDLVEKDTRTFDQTVKELRGSYMQLKHVPIVSISALTGQRVTVVLETAFAVRERMQTRVSTGHFRRAFKDWVTVNPHPMVSGKQVKMLGGKQAPADFPLFIISVANHPLVKPSYERYLINHIHDEFPFDGCPVSVIFKPPTSSRKQRSAEVPTQSTGEAQ